MTVFKKSINIPTTASTVASIASLSAGTQPQTGNYNSYVLNGPLVSPNGQVSFISMGYSSNISITSAANNSGYSYIISGVSNGTVVSETIVGPNANTVSTNTLFDIVTSVRSTNNNILAQAITIGSGSSIAIVLQNANNLADNGQPNTLYNVFVNAVGAAGAGWAAGQLNIYGVGGKGVMGPLTNTSLTYATRNNNYIAIPTTGAAQPVYTAAQLSNGFREQVPSPFSAVIVYLTTLGGVAPALVPVFIEVAQG
jgi:hypothetical protein